MPTLAVYQYTFQNVSNVSMFLPSHSPLFNAYHPLKKRLQESNHYAGLYFYPVFCFYLISLTQVDFQQKFTTEQFDRDRPIVEGGGAQWLVFI